MKHIKTYNEFAGIEEDAVKGQDSKVTVDDVYISSLDREIKGAEILGAIKAAKTEGEFKDYFYNEYGNGAFTEEEISKLVAFYNGYEEEDNLADAEAEKEEEKEDDDDLEI